MFAIRGFRVENRLREVWGWTDRGDGPVRALAADVRGAIRSLMREPGPSSIAMLTVALGIGAATTIYSVAKPVLFEPLPYADPKGLVMVWEEEASGSNSNTGYGTFADMARDSRKLESLSAMAWWSVTLLGDGRPERFMGQSVTAGFFGTLGIRPALGRDFRGAEDVPEGNNVVLLSHSLWNRRFGGDPAILGRGINLNGRTYEVIGVLPAEFESLLAPRAEIWRPLGYDPSLPWACRSCRHLRAVARLGAGVSIGEAEQELDALSAGYVAQHPTEYETAGIRLVPLHEQLVEQARPALRLVLGAAGLVLVIACANVMNLLLARALRRRPEFAVRNVLGAGRMRVARQLLTESVVLGAVGGVGGLLLAVWGVRVLVRLGPASLPRLHAVGVDLQVFAFVAVVAVGTGLLFGVLPAFVASATDPSRRLDPGTRVARSRAGRRLRFGLVVSEIALALALAVGAGLLVRSLERLLQVEVGFDPAGLLTMEVQAAGADYDEEPAVWSVQGRLIDAIAGVPGVTSAALASQIPLGGNFDRWGVRIESKPLANPALAPGADRYSVTADYLAAMDIPVVRGRGFVDEDRSDAVPVVLINESFARRSWPGDDPVGQRVQLGAPDSPWRTIVGVVGDVRHTQLDAETAPQIYMPTDQSPRADAQFVLVIRASADPASLGAAVREVVWSVDENLAIGRVRAGNELIRSATTSRRFALQIFGVFAIVALLLAGAGIYGVLSGAVAERTREIGVRAALGATRRNVLALVVRQGMQMAGVGLAVGVAIALGAGRLLGSLLFETGPNDPMTLAVVSGILGIVTLAACAAPAWRAARTDPMDTLRSD